MSVEEMKAVDLRTVDKTKLVNWGNVKLERSGNKADRIREMVQKLQNPYVYMVGDVKVKLLYSSNNRKIEDCMHGYFGGL